MCGQTDITLLFAKNSDGDTEAMNRLLPMVYDELHSLANGLMQRERPDHTLQATALVHEAYLKLIDQTRVRWQDEAHFFAVAAQAIRRILVDHARGRNRIKRGGKKAKLMLEEGVLATYEKVVDLVALDEAVTNLAADHPEHARIVEIRFFAGLSLEQTARLLNRSTRTVERRWRFARAFLFDALGGNGK